MTYKTIKVYKRPTESVPFHIEDNTIRPSEEVLGYFAETALYRTSVLLDPLTLMVSVDWPSRADKDAFLSKPGVSAHFDNVTASNTIKGIVIDHQSEEEI